MSVLISLSLLVALTPPYLLDLKDSSRLFDGGTYKTELKLTAKGLQSDKELIQVIITLNSVAQLKKLRGYVDDIVRIRKDVKDKHDLSGGILIVDAIITRKQMALLKAKAFLVEEVLVE